MIVGNDKLVMFTKVFILHCSTTMSTSNNQLGWNEEHNNVSYLDVRWSRQYTHALTLTYLTDIALTVEGKGRYGGGGVAGRKTR